MPGAAQYYFFFCLIYCTCCSSVQLYVLPKCTVHCTARIENNCSCQCLEDWSEFEYVENKLTCVAMCGVPPNDAVIGRVKGRGR